MSSPWGTGVVQERILGPSEVAKLGSLVTRWRTQNPASDAGTILRARELSDLAQKGLLKYDPLNVTGLNCIGFGAAAQ